MQSNSALFHNAVYAGDINHLQTQPNGSLSLWRQRDNGFVVFLCSNTDIIYIIWKISSMKWDRFCLCNYVKVFKHIWYLENYLIYSKKAKQTDQVNVFFGLIWCLLAVLKYFHASMNCIWERSMSQYFFIKEKKSIHFPLTMTIYLMNFMKKCPAVLFDSKNLITTNLYSEAQILHGYCRQIHFTWSRNKEKQLAYKTKKYESCCYVWNITVWVKDIFFIYSLIRSHNYCNI